MQACHNIKRVKYNTNILICKLSSDKHLLYFHPSYTEPDLYNTWQMNLLVITWKAIFSNRALQQIPKFGLVWHKVTIMELCIITWLLYFCSLVWVWRELSEDKQKYFALNLIGKNRISEEINKMRQILFYGKWIFIW